MSLHQLDQGILATARPENDVQDEVLGLGIAYFRVVDGKQLTVDKALLEQAKIKRCSTTGGKDVENPFPFKFVVGCRAVEELVVLGNIGEVECWFEQHELDNWLVKAGARLFDDHNGFG